MLDNFLKETFENGMSIFEEACQPLGVMGTVSSQTLSSVRMILEGLRALEQVLKEPSRNYKIDMYPCLTVQVESYHAMGHFKMIFLPVVACEIGRNSYFAGTDQRTGSVVCWELWVICCTNSDPLEISPRCLVSSYILIAD